MSSLPPNGLQGLPAPATVGQPPAIRSLTATQTVYLAYIGAGLSPGASLQHAGVVSSILHTWRQDKRFRSAEACVRTLAIDLGPADARLLAERMSTYGVAETLRLIRDTRLDRDRLRAIEHLHAVAGLASAAQSAGPTLVQINVSALAYELDSQPPVAQHAASKDAETPEDAPLS